MENLPGNSVTSKDFTRVWTQRKRNFLRTEVTVQKDLVHADNMIILIEFTYRPKSILQSITN
jgi:hypothetical protein